MADDDLPAQREEDGESSLLPGFARHWRIVTFAGLLGMVYYRCCLVGAPRTRFLVELGAEPFHFGLLSALGSLAIACELLAGMAASRLRRRKPVWMALFLCHRMIFLLVLAAPGLFASNRARLTWVIAVLFLHNVFVHLGDPLWFSWMTDLVPKDRFNEHWARRQRFITTGGIVAEIGIAVWFGRYEAAGQVIRGFLLLGAAGIVLGLVDIVLFAMVPEPDPHGEGGVGLRQTLTDPFRNAAFRPFLAFEIYWNFAVNLAAPFFMVYLIREMRYTAFSVQILLVLHYTGIALVSGMWGRLCDSHGFKPVLRFVVLFKFVIPLTYIVLPAVGRFGLPMMAVLYTADGMLNAALNLARKGFCLRCTPRRNRAMYVAAANFVAMGVAAGFASLLAGCLIKPLTQTLSLDLGSYHVTGYHLVFLVSCLLRAGAMPLAARLHEPQSRSIAEMITAIRCTGLFGIRLPQR